MSPHLAVIEAGPGAIRRLCCGTNGLLAADARVATAALDAIDDPVVLVDELPVPVDSLWRGAMQSLGCEQHDAVVVVHPSWWAPSRVKVVTAAAASLAGEVVTRRRSWLLLQSAPIMSTGTRVVVEIADGFVVITADRVVTESRNDEPHRVAEAVTQTVTAMTAGTTGAVLIDAPGTIAGAAALATTIAGQLRSADADLTVAEIDDAQLCSLAVTACAAEDEPDASEPVKPAGRARIGRWNRAFMLLSIAAVALTATLLGAGMVGRRSVPAAEGIPTTSLVEGRVTLTVPAQWSKQRIVAGPGSARVQVTSPADPEIALHVTQSPAADETLSGTAELLRRAIDAEPSGIFIDFTPSGHSAGRPAVTYRELRASHNIRWTVLLDGAVRISIGCQSRPGDEAAVREVCEQAVRSARALK